MERPTKKCAYCGKIFEKLKTESIKYFSKERKYCSNYCRDKGKDSSHLKKYYFVKGKLNNPGGGFKKGQRPYNFKETGYGYTAVHKWLSYHYKKNGICDICGKKEKTFWSNISGKYKRERNDFMELCYSCHNKKDNRNGGVALLHFGKYS